jgi:general secretion pathway protein A
VYLKHFKLQRNPFELSPDPRFLYRTPFHNEALASIYDAIKQRKGFVAVTGEVGTGKTLLLKCVLALLNPNEFASAFVFNPRLSTLEFLQYVMGDFGLPCGATKGQILQELNKFLIVSRERGITCVLVIDEAQHLSEETLEEIRLLTNLETTQEKLLHIVIAGQPELDDRLDSPQLRQLKQRVAFRCRLQPLDEGGTAGYVRRRLEVAGTTAEAALEIFPETTVAAIYRHSKGIPRLINTICDNALIAGFGRNLASIPPQIVNEVAADFRLDVSSSPENFSKGADGSEKTLNLLLRLLDTLNQKPLLDGDETKLRSRAV